MVVIVPPERGAVVALDGATLEQAVKRGGKLPAGTPVKGTPAFVELKPMADGQRRLRLIAGDDTLPGVELLMAAAVSGDNGLAAVIDLTRTLDGKSRLETRRLVVEGARKNFANSDDLSRLGEN
jgi:hypothetical protein